MSIGRAKRSSTSGSRVFAISRRSPEPGDVEPAPLEQVHRSARRSSPCSGPRAGPAQKVPSSPRITFSVTQVISESWASTISSTLALGLPEVDAGPRQHLDRRDQRVVDRRPDLREEADVALLDPLDPGHAGVRDLRREDVVDLADVVDRVLARGGLHRHRPVRRDQPVRAVAAPDRAVVAHLGRGPGHGQEDRAALDVVGRVDVDVDGPGRVLPAEGLRSRPA